MAKLSLTAAPTFTSVVLIPVQGKKPVPVEFTFRARNRDQFSELVENLAGRPNEDVMMDILVGWELEDEFNRESVERLLQNYIGSAKAILDKYFSEMTGAKLGN